MIGEKKKIHSERLDADPVSFLPRIFYFYSCSWSVTSKECLCRQIVFELCSLCIGFKLDVLPGQTTSDVNLSCPMEEAVSLLLAKAQCHSEGTYVICCNSQDL